jgi:hypothetical protein
VQFERRTEASAPARLLRPDSAIHGLGSSSVRSYNTLPPRRYTQRQWNFRRTGTGRQYEPRVSHSEQRLRRPRGSACLRAECNGVPDGWLGCLTIWPYGSSLPQVSTLNSDGRVKANVAIVAAGNDAAGSVNVYVTDAAQLVIDIEGFFVQAGSTSNALQFYTLPPCRIADTRNPNDVFGGPYIAGGTTRSFPVAATCNIPANATAYSLNLTAVPHGPLGHMTVWPQGQPLPLASVLNASTGTVAANAAIVPAGTPDGGVTVYASEDTDLVIDINGYFARPGPGGLSLYTVSPCRVIDTRNGAGAFNGTLALNVAGSACNVNWAHKRSC